MSRGHTASATGTFLDAFAGGGLTNGNASAGSDVIERKLRKLHRLRRCGSPNSKKAMIRKDSQSYQIQLIKALQGAETDATRRHLMATTIAGLDPTEKHKFIEFLQNVLIPCAMENNAYKAFECTNTELETILSEDNIDALNELWRLTHTQIIPTLGAMLYPLKAFDSTFNVRKAILTSFRDLVLAKILLHVRITVPSLQSMIFYISFATADNSAQYLAFNNIADRALGLKRQKNAATTASSESSNDETTDNDSPAEMLRIIRPKQRIKPMLSEPAYSRTSRNYQQKRRSTTLPTRTVHWADLQVSTVRKISLN
uniref:DUF3453 domain-containing protein n=1 Tax=Syphacia muris TaxID=451379 RepID=A0A0N5AKQ9_9BILA